MRVLDTLGTLAQVGSRFAVRPRPRPAALNPPMSAVIGRWRRWRLGALETRLAGVVVAALKEAFDRDKARMDLERETLEAERARAERALAGGTSASGRRPRARRSCKLIAMFAGCMLLVSGALAAWIGGMRDRRRGGRCWRPAGPPALGGAWLRLCCMAEGERLGGQHRPPNAAGLALAAARPGSCLLLAGVDRGQSADGMSKWAVQGRSRLELQF